MAWLVVAALAISCADSEPRAAAEAEAAWPRPQHESTDDEAWLFFAVLGKFPEPRPDFPEASYRSQGAVRGFEVRTFRGPQLKQLVEGWVAGPLGTALESDPELERAIRTATECLALDIRVPDAAHFDHVRNALGLVTWFTDLGGVAVIDPQIMRAWRPAAWRAQRFERAEAALHEQVELFWSKEGGDANTLHPVAAGSPQLPASSTVWVRSRGLRKFARPDVSMRAVRVDQFDECVRFLTELLAAQVDGAVLPTGNAVELPGHSGPVRCMLAGELGDPDFINVHLALEW